MNKKFYLLLILFFVLSVSIAQAQNNDTGMKGRGPGAGPGQRRMPPQEAIDACVNAQEGIQCTVTTPRGDAVLGTCESIGDQLACRPQNLGRGRKQGMDENNEDSASNYRKMFKEACEGKSLNNGCTLEGRQGTVNGTCIEDYDGGLLCRPEPPNKDKGNKKRKRMQEQSS